MEISVEKTGHHDEVIVTCKSTRRKWWLFGPRVESVQKYIGSVTVWRTFPEFVRCGTLKESWLSDVYKWWEYEQRSKK
jgi:hypothetical protein